MVTRRKKRKKKRRKKKHQSKRHQPRNPEEKKEKQPKKRKKRRKPKRRRRKRRRRRKKRKKPSPKELPCKEDCLLQTSSPLLLGQLTVVEDTNIFRRLHDEIKAGSLDAHNNPSGNCTFVNQTNIFRASLRPWARKCFWTLQYHPFQWQTK
jgi:hypothetical protein